MIRSAAVFLGLLLPLGIWAQTDTLKMRLDSTVVVSRRSSSPLSLKDGINTIVRLDKIKNIPAVLGNSDPLLLSRLLPSMQTNSEINSGIHVQGSENSHTAVSSGEVPVYGAEHLLGLFSVFNPSHYRMMDFTTGPTLEHNRLGGSVSMQLPGMVSKKAGGELSLGLLSAQGTLRLQTGDHSAMHLSLRKSYINLLYKDFMKIKDDPIRYGFYDANATWAWKPSKRDKITLDFYSGLDKGRNSSSSWLYMDSSWRNILGSVNHEHEFDRGGTLYQTLYYTSYNLSLDFLLSTFNAKAPSSLSTVGYKARFQKFGWKAFGEISGHHAKPMIPQLTNANEEATPNSINQSALEASLGVSRTMEISANWAVRPGMKVQYWLSNERKSYVGLSPEIAAILMLSNSMRIEMGYSLARQYLFQAGLTNLGLPCESWFLAGDLSAPQYSHNITLGSNWQNRDRRWVFSAEIYGRRLYNQVEYDGNILNYTDPDYNFKDHLLHGNGWNFGLNLMAQKQAGKVTGWIGYAFGRALRSFDDPRYPSVYPASHERLHELDAALVYNGNRWDAGTTVVAASGTPFTAAESIYLIADKLICKYGPYNGARMSPYFRVNLSFNYYFTKQEGRKQGMNLSIYNVTASKNSVAYTLRMSQDRQEFAYSSFYFKLRVLPSITYFLEF